MTQQLCRWHVYPTAEHLAERAAHAIARIGTQTVAARGAFHLVLAGGRTPCNIYQRLTNAPAAWSSWHIYFGDERCVPPSDPARNDFAARREWLDQVSIPGTQVHSMAAERGTEGAVEYAKLIETIDRFDLVLLGLGEDGHTASLFPGRVLGDAREAPAVLVVREAPKPPADRLSMSAARLSRARQVMFFATGAAKRPIVAAWREGKDIPAARIRPPGGVDIWVDAAAL